MAEVVWQARRVSDGVLVDVTGDTAGTPVSAPTPNALEVGAGSGAIAVDNTVDPPAEVTTIVSLGADVSVPGTATLVQDLQLHAESNADVMFSIFDEADNSVVNVRGGGNLILEPVADVIPLSVISQDTHGNAIAEFKIESDPVVSIGGNDNFGFASLLVKQGDPSQVPALNVGQGNTMTGVLCVFTGGVTGTTDNLGKIGFYGATAVTRPEVPAIPTAQDVVDVLVSLGLVTQAV